MVFSLMKKMSFKEYLIYVFFPFSIIIQHNVSFSHCSYYKIPTTCFIQYIMLIIVEKK